MTAISIVSALSVSESGSTNSLRTIAPFCLAGLAASFCLLVMGVDLSASWV